VGGQGDLIGANLVDRDKAGSKLHVVGDRGGLPISVVVSVPNADDSTMVEAVLDDIPPIRTPSGRRCRRRPGSMPTRPTIIAAAGRTCAGVVSGRGSPGAGSSPRTPAASVDDRAHRGVAWRWRWRRLRIRSERSSDICFNALQQPPR
jgi:hypothetical protein